MKKLKNEVLDYVSGHIDEIVIHRLIHQDKWGDLIKRFKNRVDKYLEEDLSFKEKINRIAERTVIEYFFKFEDTKIFFVNEYYKWLEMIKKLPSHESIINLACEVQELRKRIIELESKNE